MEVTSVEQHAYIKIAIFRQRNQMECQNELVEALGNNVLLQSTVVRWIGKFHPGRVSKSDDPHSGRAVSVRTNFAQAVIDHLLDYIKGHRLH
ncbi:uncharacterized protein TNCV_4013461 [Trichonephila clavipes]|nr:uncharacterized protein TNCV_4013461 [Trichonephila clavipes]